MQPYLCLVHVRLILPKAYSNEWLWDKKEVVSPAVPAEQLSGVCTSYRITMKADTTHIMNLGILLELREKESLLDFPGGHTHRPG